MNEFPFRPTENSTKLSISEKISSNKHPRKFTVKIGEPHGKVIILGRENNVLE